MRSSSSRALVAVAASAAVALSMAAPAAATTYPGPNGPKNVSGAIEQEWLSLQAGSGFRPGAPLTDERPTARAGGAYNVFENATIYFGPGAGAHEIHGSFFGYWAGQGYEGGRLGFPTTNERPAAGGVLQDFQGGHLYWSPGSRGAHQVGGSFYGLWGSLGWERSFLGFPTGEESPAGGQGVYQTFQGGTLYWSPRTGAHSVSGAFAASWGQQGYERGALGYPTSQETTSAGGAYQQFQGGILYWSAATGVHTVTGAFRTEWGSRGFERSDLGYPASQEIPTSTGVYQNFAGGTLVWNRRDGVVRRAKSVYANCTDVWNSIESPVLRGQYGYEAKFDADGDGVGCEVDPR